MTDHKLEALSLEYNNLRHEVSTRINSRYQTLTLLAATAGLVLGFAPADSELPKESVYGVGAGLLLLGLVAWIHAGWAIGALSKHLAQLEADINAVASGATPGSDLLTWERNRQSRGWKAVFFGPGHEPNPNRLA